MPKRSWKDLDRPKSPAGTLPRPAPPPRAAGTEGDDDLARAAAMAPDSRLGALMQERQVLEDRLRNLTGLPGQSGQGGGDAHRDARFRVASFAERQAEAREWEGRRAQMLDRQADAARLAPAGLTDRATPAAAADPARSGLGRFLGRVRSGVRRFDEMGQPLRDMGRQLNDQSRALDDMDRQLAAEGISAAERAEIRKAVKADAVNKAASKMDKVNKVIGAPKRAVDKIDQAWTRRERQISGAMDRFSDYARTRERRLSTETGGSGNLFERMQANRMAALRRRRDQQMQDQQDENRRARARETAAARRREDAGTTR
ncbi:MAG: hypothetical protein OIF47_07000 [Marinibacterium sp.]|nr:hypothetical protein [Marinibacterium sp.]